MLFYQQQLNMLNTKSYNKLVDICCRMISTDGEVSLQERIWMTKLSDSDSHARKVVDSFLKDDNYK